MSCPFCCSNIENSVFNQSNSFKAIYNIAPVFPGHSLVIPKKHYQRFNLIPDGLISEMMLFTRNVMRQIETVFKADGFDITIQDGFWAGQTVEHFHLHILPRYKNDFPDPGDWYPVFEKNNEKILDSVSRTNLNFEQINTIVAKLKKC